MTPRDRSLQERYSQTTKQSRKNFNQATSIYTSPELLLNCHFIFQTKSQAVKSANETKCFTCKLSWKKNKITSIHPGGEKKAFLTKSPPPLSSQKGHSAMLSVSNPGFPLECEFVIYYRAQPLGKPLIHSTNINSALLGPGGGCKIRRPTLLLGFRASRKRAALKGQRRQRARVRRPGKFPQELGERQPSGAERAGARASGRTPPPLGGPAASPGPAALAPSPARASPGPGQLHPGAARPWRAAPHPCYPGHPELGGGDDPRAALGPGPAFRAARARATARPHRVGHPRRAPAWPWSPSPRLRPCSALGPDALTLLGFLPPGQRASEFPQEGVIFLPGRGRLGSGGLGDRGRLLRGRGHGGGAGSRARAGRDAELALGGCGGTEAAAFQTEAELFQAFEAAHARLSLPSLPPSRRPPPWKELRARGPGRWGLRPRPWAARSRESAPDLPLAGRAALSVCVRPCCLGALQPGGHIFPGLCTQHRSWDKSGVQ